MNRAVLDLLSRSLLSFSVAIAVAAGVHDTVKPQRDDTPPPAEPDAVFGLYDATGELHPGEVVPLVTGGEFGWRLALADDELHVWREVMLVPAAPQDWFGDDLVISPDRKVAVTERSEVAQNGVLEHAWTITDGDQPGPHEMRLYLDGRWVETFRFVVR